MIVVSFAAASLVAAVVCTVWLWLFMVVSHFPSTVLVKLHFCCDHICFCLALELVDVITTALV